MTGSNSWLKPVVYPPLDAAGLAEIRQRVADGIFLGGDYRAAYEQYLIAHRDRADRDRVSRRPQGKQRDDDRYHRIRPGQHKRGYRRTP